MLGELELQSPQNALTLFLCGRSRRMHRPHDLATFGLGEGIHHSLDHNHSLFVPWHHHYFNLEKAADPDIRETVSAHRDDRVYLDGAYRGQVNENIQDAYDDRGRYEELADPKYTDVGGIFDIMAVTVIDQHLTATV